MVYSHSKHPVKVHTSIFLLTSLFSSAIPQEKAGGEPKQKGKRPDLARAADFFKQLDLDSDGRISRDEFAKGKRVAQLPVEDRTKLFDRLDKNDDGFLTGRELSPAPRDRHGQFLEKADKDKDGRVSREEFIANPPFAQADPERLNKMFDRMDRNSDGFLDGKDHGPGGGRKRPPRIDFGKWDLDKDGAISWEEFQKSPAIRHFTDKERRQQFDKIDVDDDGKLTAGEFKKLFEKRFQRKPRRPEPKK